jgi:transcriptional regulator with XRE-family HTH domain
VISCKACGLVQYRTRTGNCRRCLRLLPLVEPEPEQAIRTSARRASGRVRRQGSEKWLFNLDMVENLGQRIQQLRKFRKLTQKELYKISGVSRSYLARIESSQMTPSLGTLEKISEALGIGLNRFFAPANKGEALLEDPFIQDLHPLMGQLDFEQWQSIVKGLAAISKRVALDQAKVRHFTPTRAARMDDLTRRPVHPAEVGRRLVR